MDRCSFELYIYYAGRQFCGEEFEGFRSPLIEVYSPSYPDKNNPEALSQLYKMMNYKPTSNKGEKLTTEQVANFLKVNKKEGDNYDDIMYYDDAKIKVTSTLTQELVLRQTFLIAKGYFDPKEYFQAIKIDNLDDQTFDNKIKAMFN